VKYEGLTDEEWSFIYPLISPPAHTGRSKADDRTTLYRIFFVLTQQDENGKIC